MTRPAPAPRLRRRFWERYPLAQLTRAEWEALCDRCGRCCLRKLEDEDTREVVFTRVACRLLCTESATCMDYPQRRRHVPDCVQLTAANIAENAYWMPETCAYRRLHHGEGLPEWHPLLTGRAESVAEAGISMAGRTLPETGIPDDELEDHVLEETF
ncbi:MAG: YcgN family cysteine cluster protein [Rhodobacteraceae bacterium]|nr:YcgN family cysteine cluster protein [Paracoccaceae bacterium]